MYIMLILQSLYMFLAYGSLSGNEYPWKPSIDNDNWEPSDRLFPMFFVIAEITTVFFNILPFYLAARVLNEGHQERITDCLVPTNSILRCTKSLVIIIIVSAYFLAGGYISYLFQATRKTEENYFRIVFIATIVGAVIGPILLLFSYFRYAGKEFINSRFQFSFKMLMITCLIWTV
mmetsp:Transcript_17054/g.15004  ORF Transcript_17054/g.15004 Transcript_17054/m.15004 type:complete len:176 (+) Transcript_17054:142-669(+)